MNLHDAVQYFELVGVWTYPMHDALFLDCIEGCIEALVLRTNCQYTRTRDAYSRHGMHSMHILQCLRSAQFMG